MRITLALFLGAVVALAIACGAAPRKSAMAPSMPDAGGPGGMRRDPRIVQLDQEIDEQLQRLELARPPSTPPAPGCEPGCLQPMSVTAATDPQCHPGPSEVCKQSCEVADAICSASSKICSIASELGNDAWANERCTNGKASCDSAHGKCCGCT